jgi:hypothetical protein
VFIHNVVSIVCIDFNLKREEKNLLKENWVVRLIFDVHHQYCLEDHKDEDIGGSCNTRGTSIHNFFEKMQVKGARIGHSVQRLATRCTVRGSNPGVGEFFRTRLDRLWGPTQPPMQWVPGLSRG